jgi:hypothetical protein
MWGKEKAMSGFTTKFHSLLVLTILVLMPSQPAVGQTQPPKASIPSNLAAKTNDDFSAWGFEALLHERDTLGQQIAEVSAQINWINDAIAKRANRQQLIAQHKSTEDLDKDISLSLSYAGMPGVALNELDTRLVQHQNTAEEKQNRKAAVDAELNRRVDLERPKQVFKLQMSGVFAMLVGVVIVGFFVMAFKDEQVRREIFAGQSGIQFVTLFSLVIAIILFGIIDVLEGKELAALLGGLSGYILGRSTPTGGPRKGAGAAEQPQLGVQGQPAGRAQAGGQVEPVAQPQ